MLPEYTKGPNVFRMRETLSITEYEPDTDPPKETPYAQLMRKHLGQEYKVPRTVQLLSFSSEGDSVNEQGATIGRAVPPQSKDGQYYLFIVADGYVFEILSQGNNKAFRKRVEEMLYGAVGKKAGVKYTQEQMDGREVERLKHESYLKSRQTTKNQAASDKTPLEQMIEKILGPETKIDKDIIENFKGASVYEAWVRDQGDKAPKCSHCGVFIHCEPDVKCEQPNYHSVRWEKTEEPTKAPEETAKAA